MKNLIIVFVFSLLFTSCKKDEPTLAETVQGTYKISTVKLNDKAVSGLTGSITLSTESELVVGANIKLTYQGSTETADISGLTLEANGADIDISQDGSLVGTVSGNNILFYFEDTGDTWEFKATK